MSNYLENESRQLIDCMVLKRLITIGLIKISKHESSTHL